MKEEKRKKSCQQRIIFSHFEEPARNDSQERKRKGLPSELLRIKVSSDGRTLILCNNLLHFSVPLNSSFNGETSFCSFVNGLC
jgi:hypothetical protein